MKASNYTSKIKMKNILNEIPNIKNTDNDNFFLLAGPCAIEGEVMALKIAEKIVKITDKLKIPYVFKGSFKKANRSKIDSFTGIGDEKALKILAKVSKTFDIPTITDIHSVNDAERAANYVDVLQIPAFLTRQTDLIISAAKTGKVVNLKKGQFMSPKAMKYVVEKVNKSGNNKAWITERGTMFGYKDMIVDFRGISEMRDFAPVIIDVTHSLQLPNQSDGITQGRPEMIETIARAGVVNNVDGIFIETHFDPMNANSDGATMLDLKYLESLLKNLTIIRKTIVSL
tara:strand:- start:15560 stop:16417 length:858 start_codon:yes stop_codon:yes gene_type:complete